MMYLRGTYLQHTITHHQAEMSKSVPHVDVVITGGDDVKLKICTACKLLKYCSVNRQKNHRSYHKKACSIE